MRLSIETFSQCDINTDFYLAFLAAAGYAGASVLYGLAPPPFVRLPYTVAEFAVSSVFKSCVTSFNFWSSP